MRFSQDNKSILVFYSIAAILGAVAVGAQAGSIPFQDTWTYDGPQPHGPGETVLFDHAPYNNGGYASDTMAFESSGGSITWQLLADNFVLPSTSLVNRLQFWGFYNESIEPTGDDSFEVRFYHPREDGLPGAMFYQTVFASVPRTWTGRQVLSFGGGREYSFTVDLPSAPIIGGGEPQWLSIFQVGDASTSFRWELNATEPFDGTGIQNPTYPNWAATLPFGDGANTAFRLINVPEPATAGILALGFILLASRKRRAIRKKI